MKTKAKATKKSDERTFFITTTTAGYYSVSYLDDYARCPYMANLIWTAFKSLFSLQPRIAHYSFTTARSTTSFDVDALIVPPPLYSIRTCTTSLICSGRQWRWHILPVRVLFCSVVQWRSAWNKLTLSLSLSSLFYAHSFTSRLVHSWSVSLTAWRRGAKKKTDLVSRYALQGNASSSYVQ